MPIEKRTEDRTPIIFLFAHQDDEMGVFFEIEDVSRRGLRPICLYLTDGAQPGVEPASRCAESSGVLRQLGVAEGDIFFIGKDVSIPDGRLHEHVAGALVEARRIIASLSSVEAFVMHAYEGGHQDHDIVHAIGVRLAEEYGVRAASRQFTLYRASNWKFPPYVMFSPLPENGPVFRKKIAFADRVRYLRLLSQYATQRKAVAGLLPFILVDYLFDGEQKLQGIDPIRLSGSPHPGKPLYERRGRASYQTIRRQLIELLQME